MRRLRLIALAAATLATRPSYAAETGKIRLSHGFGIPHVPLIAMPDRKLLKQRMLAGTLDIAGPGAPGFTTLRAKAREAPRAAVLGLCGQITCALSLSTNRPGICTLADFRPDERIALPTRWPPPTPRRQRTASSACPPPACSRTMC